MLPRLKALENLDEFGYKTIKKNLFKPFCRPVKENQEQPWLRSLGLPVVSNSGMEAKGCPTVAELLHLPDQHTGQGKV